MLSSTDFHTKKFIVNAILSAVQSSDNNSGQMNDVPNASQAIVRLVNYSIRLRKGIKPKFNDFTSFTKKSAEDFYFIILEYDTKFARRTRNVHDVHESARLSEMKESNVKLNVQCPAGARDTSRCRQAFYQDVCFEDYGGEACREFATFEKDHLFKDEAALRVFKKILKYRCSTSTEICLLALIISDSIVSDTMYSFSLCLQSATSPEESLLQYETFYVKFGERSMIKSYYKGTIPQGSLRRMTQLLPVCAPNLLTSFLGTLRKVCVQRSMSRGLKTSVTPSGLCDEMRSRVS